ncbi:hypothetical protein FJZ26_02095 [Candidatus Parvarchaeota archaeon]|nr:hypothetical protein [Candidatus Parvarchaeota archaeon]
MFVFQISFVQLQDSTKNQGSSGATILGPGLISQENFTHEMKVRESAVKVASAAQFDYLFKITAEAASETPLVLGPTGDASYFYRYGKRGSNTFGAHMLAGLLNMIRYGVEHNIPLAQKDIDDKLLPLEALFGAEKFRQLSRMAISNEELDCLFQISFNARIQGAQSVGGQAVPKHLFFGSSRLETSEGEIVKFEGGLKKLMDECKVFVDNLLQPKEKRAKLAMVSHCQYPQAQEEAVEKYLDLPGLGASEGVPSTFSPQLVRGFLRREMKFDGVIVSDALTCWGCGHSCKNCSRSLRMIKLTFQTQNQQYGPMLQ